MHLKVYWPNGEAPGVLRELHNRGFRFDDVFYSTRWAVAYFEIPRWDLVTPELVGLLDNLPYAIIWAIGE